MFEKIISILWHEDTGSQRLVAVQILAAGAGQSQSEGFFTMLVD